MTQNTSRKVIAAYDPEEDSLVWKKRFVEFCDRDDRSPDTEKKIELQLQHFIDFFQERYRSERVGDVVKQDIKAWLDFLYDEDTGLGYRSTR